jgi:hypothetical protein
MSWTRECYSVHELRQLVCIRRIAVACECEGDLTDREPTPAASARLLFDDTGHSRWKRAASCVAMRPALLMARTHYEALVTSLGAAQRAAEATAFSPNEAAPARAIGAVFRQ